MGKASPMKANAMCLPVRQWGTHLWGMGLDLIHCGLVIASQCFDGIPDGNVCAPSVKELKQRLAKRGGQLPARAYRPSPYQGQRFANIW